MAIAFSVDDFVTQIKVDNPNALTLPNIRAFITADQFTWQIPQFVVQEGFVIFRDDSYILLRCVKACNKSPRLVFLNEANELVFDEFIALDGSVVAKSIDFAGLTKFQMWNVEGFEKQKKIAVFTHSFNESLHLKIFFEHYSKLTDPSDIFVIDHGSDVVKAKDVLPDTCQVIYLPKTPRDDFNIKQYCEYFQRFLLQTYEWVIHVDVDEMLVYEHGLNALKSLLFNSNRGKVLKPQCAYELFQNPDEEKEIAEPVKICENRKHILRNDSYIKPVVTSIPVYWGPGFHYCLNDLNTETIDGLWMLHLKYVCIKHRVEQQFGRKSNDHSPQQLFSLGGTLGPQNIKGTQGIPHFDSGSGKYISISREEAEMLLAKQLRDYLIKSESVPNWLRESL